MAMTRNRKLVLTSGDVAKMLCVAPRTVAKWCDTGRIPHWRIPGSRDRRFSPDDVVRFVKEHGVSGDALRRVLRVCCLTAVVIGTGTNAASLAAALGEGWDVLSGADAFTAGGAFRDAGRSLAAVVVSGSTGLHMPTLGEWTRAVNPDAALVVCGPGDLGGDLHADGWHVLPADATASQVAEVIRKGVG